MSNPARAQHTPTSAANSEANYEMKMNAKEGSEITLTRRRAKWRSSMTSIAGAALMCAAGAWLGGPARAQQTQSQQNSPARPSRPTDLARENLGLVAASATEISTVLQQDPGLMVDLKEWIAQDATNQGQVLAETDLTDLAVMDRLQTDSHLRAVATGL